MAAPATAAAVESMRVLASGRPERENRSAKLSRLNEPSSTGPRNFMKASTTTAKNGASEASTTAQQRAGQDRGHDDRQGHRPEAAPARGAKVLARLLDGHVDGLQPRDRRQEDIRVQSERIHGDDAADAVHGGEGNAKVAQ